MNFCLSDSVTHTLSIAHTQTLRRDLLNTEESSPLHSVSMEHMERERERARERDREETSYQRVRDRVESRENGGMRQGERWSLLYSGLFQ